MKDFLDALASKKAGEPIGDTYSGADLTGIYFTPEQKKRHIDLLPQVVETNTPRPMDVAGEGLLYDERVIRVYLADALTEEHSALDLRLFDLKLQ